MHHPESNVEFGWRLNYKPQLALLESAFIGFNNTTINVKNTQDVPWVEYLPAMSSFFYEMKRSNKRAIESSG